MTPNVRRILTYQRTFAHYLADEEAQLGQGGGSSTPMVPAAPNRTRLPMHPPPRPLTPRTISTTATPANLKRERSSTDLAASTTPTPVPIQKSTTSTSQVQPPSSIGGAVAQLPINPDFDNDPLLKSHTPKLPSARVMEALLSEPPLLYTAARAKPVDGGKPARHFCAICGYWGKVKCRKCGERTCGLMECWRAHEVGCGPY